jgi:hypothetical protein
MVNLSSVKETLLAKKQVESPKRGMYFSTGCTLLDLVVGGGEKAGYGMGYEAGTIVRDWGGSSSTKTFKAVELISANYHKYKDKFKWKYADVEGGNTIDSLALYGFEIISTNKKGREAIPATVEEWEYDVANFIASLKEDECGIYVLDSLDSLSSKELDGRKEDRHAAFAKGKDYDEGSYNMASAKFLSQEMFRGLSAKLAEKNALLYIISQERDNANAGLYGKKNRLGGGRAVGFYETARIYSKLKQTEEKRNRAIGVVIETTAEKVRHPRPFRNCLVPIKFDYGIDDVAANVDFLFECRSDKTGELLKSAKSIEWEKGVETMDRDDLIAYIEANKLKKVLRQKVIDKWESIEADIRTERKQKYGGEDE